MINVSSLKTGPELQKKIEIEKPEHKTCQLVQEKLTY